VVTPDHDHPTPNSPLRFATSATLHCLLGCGIGEVLGDAIGTVLNFSNAGTIALALLGGLIGGFALGVRPYRKRGIAWPVAMRQVAITEGLSIAVMETAEALVEVFTPGLMAATVLQPFYWFGMMLALVAGFLAAWPVNLVLTRRGVHHVH
jgi:uncharacterized protein DUF4396